MRAITLPQPAAHCVAWHGCRVLNLPRLPVLRRGSVVAVYARKHGPSAGLAERLRAVERDHDMRIDPGELAAGAVVAIGRVIGDVGMAGDLGFEDGRAEEARRARRGGWFAGPVALLLGDVIPLLRPVACAARAGRSWRLPGFAAQLDVQAGAERAAALVLASRRPRWLNGCDMAVRQLLLSDGLAECGPRGYDLSLDGRDAARRIQINEPLAERVLSGEAWG